MKGDLSRETFNRALHFSAVRLQQGRIVTDADWNEQGDLTRYRAERQALDIIGRCGAPMDGAGYGLVAETNALAVHAVNANVAWVLAEDGALLTTSNAGADWSLVDLGTAAQLRALQQVDGVGWLVGDGGLVRKTSDQGATWIAQNPGTLGALRGVSVFDADHAWAVGDGGVVVATLDGGASWTLAQTDAARLHAVHFIDASTGLAVGQSGVIVATVDGGQTWVSATSGTTAQLRALAVMDSTLVWAAGQDGCIIRSEDFGATWLPCNTPSTATLYGIGFRDANEGWAVGADGVVLHSTDGGANWVLIPSGTTATLRGLSLFAGDPAWAVGDASSVLRLGTGAPAVVLPAVNLSLEPGRCYVNGTLCELETRSSYAHQPDGGEPARLARGAHLLYLDVWQRHLSALEAPPIREVALGGPDTATRTQTVVQVKALELPAASPFDWNCTSSVPAWDALVHAPRPRLAARSEPQLAPANLCEIAATAGYRRLENQLYRVEVHEGGANPTFKWSRENGSVAYAVVSVSVDAAKQQTVVRVAARGRDANLDAAVHDRLELIDDDADLSQRAGVLLEYLNDGEDELELVLAGVPRGTLGLDPSRHPVLRRWDHRPGVAGAQALPIIEGTWIELEDGVQVRFEPGGSYRAGDYWQIPARTITADIEWPKDGDGDPLAREPAGVADAYCRLGIVEIDSEGRLTIASDCRDIFPPLTSFEQLFYVSGDGQDAAPGQLLPQPLALRVARGTVPVAGVSVRFEVESGGGTLGAGPGGSWLYETTTDVEGQATCQWTLGPGAVTPSRFQRVRATLIDKDHLPTPGQVIVYCATASLELHYVSGDGQQGAASASLPYALEVRVANGGDGIAGAALRATVEDGGGSVVGPTTLTTDSQGLAAVEWQIGASGPQRLRVELLDDSGQVMQRQSFNAAIAVSSGGAGCEVTIGQGGQYAALDMELLAGLLATGGGRACICFLPGTHDVGTLEADGGLIGRLTLHGCGRASVLNLNGNLTLTGFAALEMRDLVIQGGVPGVVLPGVVLQGIADLRISSVDIESSQAGVNAPGLRVSGVQDVAVTGCAVTAALGSMAAVFENIGGSCRIDGNRFVGMVSFYGVAEVLPPQLLQELFRIGKQLQVQSARASLLFSNNLLSTLTIGAALVKQLLAGNASGVFASAVVQGNVISESGSLFAAGLLSFSGNTLLALPQGLPYGVMIAHRAAANGNVAPIVGDQAQLLFATPASGGFAEAGNQVFILN
jgi:photosystem II stability/assembly factor-like uncharacterized protein